MTFYEAAIEVLRDAGRPLHYKKIAAQAIEQSLLSHVGRDPYETMNARLNQEVQKKSGDTLVKLVRPGVYELKKGVDTADAKQTIQLRKVAPIEEPDWENDDDDEPGDDDDEEEEEEGKTEAGPEEADASDEGSQLAGGKKSGRRKRAKKSRHDDESARDGDPENTRPDTTKKRGEDKARGDDGPTPSDDTEPAPAEQMNADAGADADDRTDRLSDDDQNAGEGDSQKRRGRRGGRGRGNNERGRRGRGRRGRGRRRPTADQPVVQTGESSGDDGELATKIAGLLEKAGRRGWTQRRIAKALADQPGIEAATDTMVRSVLETANERRAAAGHTPLFTEMKPGTWALAAASSEQLGASYAALSAWQARHRGLLIDELANRVIDFDDATIRSTLLLVIERLGYRDIEAMAQGSTWLATVSVGMSDDRVAVRIHDEDVADERHINNFREDLIDAGAVSGVLLTTPGVLDEAMAKAGSSQPRISVVDSDAFAEWMLRAGVGVAKMNLNVNCLDDAFFES